MRALTVGCAALVLVSCVQPTPVAQPQPSNDPQPVRSAGDARPRPRTARVGDASPGPYAPARWPIKTSEHVDLWLHSFALVSDDTTTVPLYRRGYRDSLTVVKNRAGVLTSLDVNRATLTKRLAAAPRYLQAQFLPFEFANWEEMRAAAEKVALVDTDASRISDRTPGVRAFASIFSTAADREWLRLFLAGVQDEQLRFFDAEHSRNLRARSAVVTAVDSLWQQVYRTRFNRFLNNTSQREGDILLSMPLGGEGRAGMGRDRQTVIAVPFPDRVEDALDVILVMAHEITGSLVSGVIGDNTTPAEQRAGLADRYVALAQVRAGAMLLDRIAPELSGPYKRYYLAQSGIRSDVATMNSRFLQTYDIPVAIRDGIQRQVDIVLGGI